MRDPPWNLFLERLRALVGRYIREAELEERIVEHVLEKAADALPVLDWPRRLETWLFQITRNRILDAWRRGDVPVAPAGTVHEGGEDDDDPAGFSKSLRPLLGELPESERELLDLVDYEGAGEKVVLRRLGIDRSELPQRIAVARAHLRTLVLQNIEKELGRRPAE